LEIGGDKSKDGVSTATTNRSHDEESTHGNLPPSKFWETFGESLAAYSRARRGVKPKNSAEEFKRIRSDILIPVVVIPECVNLKKSSWNPARRFS
jgi:hypothetical protein